MAITIGGLLTITTIQQRERTVVLTDDGALEPALTLTGLISRRSHSTLALARVAERQLHEMAHWSRVAGGIHVDSSEFDVDDGLYELRDVRTRTDPVTGVSIGITVGLTLVRLGGAGPGGNVVRRLLPQATLITNGFSVTSTPRYGMPVGASLAALLETQTVATADGSQNVMGSTTAATYTHNAADYNKAEVKVWDTGGSATPGDWTRVFGPDHVFADATHCAIDNGRVRLVPLSAVPGCHAISVWDGSAWVTLTSSGQGDLISMGGTGFSAWVTCRIVDITPWRVEVQWSMTRATTPWFPTKTYTLVRGQPLAKLTLAADTTATMGAGMIGHYDYTFVKQTNAIVLNRMKDHNTAAEAGAFDFASGSEVSQPFIAAINDDATVMALMGTTTLSGMAWNKNSNGGFNIATTGAVSSFVAAMGGIAYDAGKLMIEAEAGTLGGTAAVTQIAGGSGGTNVVTLPAASDLVQTNGHSNPPAGSIVLAFARVQNSGTSASDSLTLAIRNVTTASTLTGSSQTVTASTLGSAGTWKWISVIGTGWNGTDTIAPRVTRAAAGGGGNLYVDEMVLVTVSNGAYLHAEDVARAVLTDVRVRAQTIRQVR